MIRFRMKPPREKALSRSRILGRIRQSFCVLAASFGGAVLGALILPYILAGDIYDYQDSVDGVHLPEVDAIVCLAGGRGRIAAAGDLWYRYWEAKKTPILYISGMGPNSNWGVLIRQLRTGVRSVVRPENVVLETESMNTESNARWLARFALQRNWTRILLITSPYHMKRAHYIFERVLEGTGRSFQISTLSVFQEPFEPGEWRTDLHGIRVTLWEYLKLVYYRHFWKA